MKELVRTTVVAVVIALGIGCGGETQTAGVGDASQGTGGASGGSSTGGGTSRDASADVAPAPVDAGSTTSCATKDDCTWGEIDHEIAASTDCICLFGCPSIVMNKQTSDRRRAQYQALCDPRYDGKGQPCPIDDCIQPPALACTGGVCAMPGDR